MNELKVFGKVRTAIVEDKLWFVAKDVCEILEINNSRQATSRLGDDEKDVISNDTLGGKQKLVHVNEYGLYNLVFMSKKPEAKEFKKWVTHEVIPSIRKHGAYMTDNTLEKALTSPNFLIQLATNLKNEQEARKLAESKVAEQQEVIEVLEPKAQYHDDILDSVNSFTITEIANDLGMTARKFNSLVNQLKVQRKI
ncbi:BRO family protein [Bacillus nitratireducens]|uniref:BRO family protein n=1 Tax=Bacillus nitratireducens TaxID=2026193 RepID=UPI002E1C330E|nr:BRO family protein [Bacillus nitratireducens]